MPDSLKGIDDTPEERLRNFRLPGDLRPYNYHLEVQPDIYTPEEGFPTVVYIQVEPN